MCISWTSRCREFKSPWPVLAAALLRSRENKSRKVQDLQEKSKKLEQWVRELEAQGRRKDRTIQALQDRVWTLEAENHTLAEQRVRLPDHSVQTGPEKALLVLGMRASKMPEPGTPWRINWKPCWKAA